MQAQIKKDETLRTVEVEVTDGPQLKDPATWRDRPPLFQVTKVRIVIQYGALHSVRVSGPTVRANGSLSPFRSDSAIWVQDDELRVTPEWSAGPEWLVRLVGEAVIEGPNAYPVGEPFGVPE